MSKIRLRGIIKSLPPLSPPPASAASFSSARLLLCDANHFRQVSAQHPKNIVTISVRRHGSRVPATSRSQPCAHSRLCVIKDAELEKLQNCLNPNSRREVPALCAFAPVPARRARHGAGPPFQPFCWGRSPGSTRRPLPGGRAQGAAAVNVRTQEAVEVLAVCLYAQQIVDQAAVLKAPGLVARLSGRRGKGTQ